MNLILTEDELRLLSAPGLSHEARSLYLLFIRPMALNGKAMLDLRALRDQMSVQDSRSPGGYSYRPDDDMLQELLFELLGQRLISRREGTDGLFEDGETVFLPAADCTLTAEGRKPNLRLFPISESWRPSDGFPATAVKMGLDGSDWSERELADFITSAWADGRVQSASRWDVAFARFLRSRRYPREYYTRPISGSERYGDD